MLRRLLNYLKTALGMAAERRMDPSVQLEQAMREATQQDRELREQAARVIAHRSELQMKLDRAVDAAAKAKQNAGQALVNLEGAHKKGDTAAADKWQRTAQSLALELETQERLVEGLKSQFAVANEQAELAKRQVNNNALRLKQLSAKRMELLGKLEQARMQETVNRTLESLNRPLETAGPSITEIEDKINSRMSLASAKAELESNSLEGAQREIEESSLQMAGQARLESLRAELGLGGASDGSEESNGTSTSSDEPLLLEDGGLDADAIEQRAREGVEVEQGDKG